MKAPRDAYLTHCIRSYRKTIISYTLSLNEEQMALVRGQVALLDQCLIPWEPRLPEKYYAARLQTILGLRFYRIVRGRFRKYFIPTINCVSITDYLLGETELGHAHIMGIKTPGAYMDHLERQYLAETGLVTDRRVYTVEEVN